MRWFSFVERSDDRGRWRVEAMAKMRPWNAAGHQAGNKAKAGSRRRPNRWAEHFRVAKSPIAVSNDLGHGLTIIMIIHDPRMEEGVRLTDG